MTYTDKGERHEVGSLNKFGHLTFWVGNAKQAAEWYCTKFGFQPCFYKGKSSPWTASKIWILYSQELFLRIHILSFLQSPHSCLNIHLVSQYTVSMNSLLMSLKYSIELQAPVEKLEILRENMPKNSLAID